MGLLLFNMAGIAPKNKLYKALSVECGVADTDSSMRFYYGFVRYVLRELRENGKIQLPDFGTFEVVTDKPRRYMDVRSGVASYLPEVKRVSFRPSRKLKEYAKNKF